MTTTPHEPAGDPEIVPSLDPSDPVIPTRPDTESDPQTDPATEGP